MNENFYISLIYQRLNGEISEEESQQLEIWLAESSENQALADDLEDIYNESESYLIEDIANIDINAAFEEQLNLIEPEAKPVSNTNPIAQKRPSRSISRWMSIAAIILLGVIAVIWWQDVQSNNTSEQIFAVAEEGIKVLNLSDGSEVTLDEGSELKYMSQFSDDFRPVVLEKGRAKFDIAKNKGTFQVKTPLGLVTVLGTIFNVQLDEAGILRVNVAEGKVNIQPIGDDADSGLEMNATVGEVVQLSDGMMTKIKFEEDKQLNYFEFQHTPLAVIYETLNSFFDANLKVSKNDKKCYLNATFKDNTLKEILEIIEKLKAECE